MLKEVLQNELKELERIEKNSKKFLMKPRREFIYDNKQKYKSVLLEKISMISMENIYQRKTMS
ncbi:MAG: hypothetical protein ACLR4C_08100 [Eubacterium ventriosum]